VLVFKRMLESSKGARAARPVDADRGVASKTSAALVVATAGVR
jgi:hypothetical protein